MPKELKNGIPTNNAEPGQIKVATDDQNFNILLVKNKKRTEELLPRDKERKEKKRQMKKEVEKLSEKIEMLEREKRRNSIVIQGLEIDTFDENDLKIEMENFIEKELDVKPKNLAYNPISSEPNKPNNYRFCNKVLGTNKAVRVLFYFSYLPTPDVIRLEGPRFMLRD
ncbi:hypothetical protein ILUMI_13834 [Ignelater luminosus]|uniref:Uncharacterized protein n=1 Tax=Ignelater luminosus TaxID=2038154 RepID=A0A8K0CX18_IGNLU|nr:hypothetical protein ILUMI_13834 [Ignelater luminosus]